jgi:hypothetical protein
MEPFRNDKYSESFGFRSRQVLFYLKENIIGLSSKIPGQPGIHEINEEKNKTNQYGRKSELFLKDSRIKHQQHLRNNL